MNENQRDPNERRRLVMMEQSINESIKAYVFEPNDVNTWVIVKDAIIQYLKALWKQGELAGTVPEDAFSVDVGLGTSMTPEDILEGTMRVIVKVALMRPADFTVLKFEQQMQKS